MSLFCFCSGLNAFIEETNDFKLEIDVLSLVASVLEELLAKK